MRSLSIVCLAVCLCFSIAAAGDTIKREFSTEAGKLLDIELDTGGSITIMGWDKNEAEITVFRQGRDWRDCQFDINERSSGIQIISEFDHKWQNKNTDVHVEIKVPQKYDLDIKTLGGDVNIENITGKIRGTTYGGDLLFDNLDGDLDFHTMGGTISCSRINGEMDITTNGGEISCTDSKVNGRAHTNGGDINIRSVSGNLECTTNGGRVRYDNEGKSAQSPQVDDVVTIKTMGGDINLDEAPYGADVKTNGGDITIKKAGKFIIAKTNGGDIEIDEVDGWVEAKTNGGDVSVNMVDRGAYKDHAIELSSYGGEITLILPKNFSGQFDIELAYTKNARRKYKIISDFDIKSRESDNWDYDRGSPRKYIDGTGIVNDGKNKVRIKTINGDVIIKKG